LKCFVTFSFSGSGVQPTKWQKRFLVITRLYQRQSDIPPYVATGTMNRMHDRMRVVFILVGVTVFFVIFFVGEFSTHQRITRDRDAGVFVKKM
uniref:Ion_trans domain-containing protein n=1 Tax=Angiostrongylus costaricensis TaxID=334426 RepID=A0A0R3PNS9_ANGCS